MTRIGCVALLVLGASISPSAQTAPSLFADRSYNASVGRVSDVAFSPDGRLLAVVGSGGLAISDTQSGASVRQVPIAQDAVARVAFGGPATVVVGTEKGAVSAVSLLTGQLRELVRHSRPITAVALSADGTVGASGDAGGDIAIWSTDGTSQPERLREDTRRAPIVVLAFASATTMVSITKELSVSTWDVPKRRTVRRGTLQLEALGRAANFSAAGVEVSGTQLALASQYLARPRGGLLAGGGDLARPEDLKRTNVILPYGVESGLAGDAIQLGDFLAEHLALSPGGCFALFTSNYREQPRLHVWSLIKQGQDVVRLELPATPTAIALDPTGRYVAAGLANGEVRTWRASGATASDCALYRAAQAPPAAPVTPRVALGSEGQPLFPPGTGFKVAVLRFEVGGVEAFLGDAVAEMVNGELSNSASVVVVERAAIESIVKEMQLQSSGLTAADAARVGRGLNAQKVVLGSVRRFGEGTYVISARVVDVETQQVQGSREVTCEACSEADLPAAVRALRRVIVP